MEFVLDFDQECSRVVIETRGIAALEGFVGYMKARTSDPRWRSGMDVLIDHTDLDTSPVDYAFIDALVDETERFADTLGSGRCAIVTGSGSSFGLARVFEALAEARVPTRYRVFRSRAEAEAWLGEGRSAAEPTD